MPTEAEIVNAKSVIQSEESALQNVEDALARGQEAHNASVLEADELKDKEIAAILERHEAQVLRLNAFWEQKRAELSAQRKDIEGRLAHQREFVAPVKWLPSEVLSEIFTVYVDCGDTPWTLLCVCRLWKGVAISTPRIWRFIQIDRDEGRFNSGTSFQNCFTSAHLERALSRTGAAPLHISIALPRDIRDRSVDLDRIFALFGTLTKVLSRCDTLKLKDTDRFFSAEDQGLFTTLQFPISSSLKCLCIGYGWESSGIAQKLLVASNHESAAVREFSLRSNHRDSLVHSLSNHQNLLKRLISFSASDFRVPKDLFAAMRSLTCFSQADKALALPEVSSVTDLLEEAEFSRTTFLEFSAHQFGNLKKLVIHWCTIPMQPGAIKAPILDTLIFKGRSWLPILVFECPSLSRLELEDGPSTKSEARKELNQIWGPEQSFGHLKTLKIDLVMSDAVLVSILKKLPFLEHLSLYINRQHRIIIKNIAVPGDTFFNSLLITNSHRLGFLQNLRTLSLRSNDLYSPESLLIGLRAGMKRVVRSRQHAAPLWSAALEIMWEQNRRELVNKEEFTACEEMQ